MVRSRDGYKGGNPGGYSGGNSGPSPGGSTSGSLEQRLDRWVSAGRQLVDGVAGAPVACIQLRLKSCDAKEPDG